MNLVQFSSPSSSSSSSAAPTLNTKMISVLEKLEATLQAKLQEHNTLTKEVSALEQQQKLDEEQREKALTLARAQRDQAQANLDKEKAKADMKPKVIHSFSPETYANPEKIRTIADNFFHGRGIEKNLKVAFHFYNTAAGKGSVEAMYAVGCMYINGQAPNKSYWNTFDGKKWLVKAADQGHAKSMLKISDLFWKAPINLLHILNIGIKIKAEYVPLYYLLEAVRLGLPEATERLTEKYNTLPPNELTNIGHRFHAGCDGIWIYEERPEIAFQFFQAAAKRGSPTGKVMQAFMYCNGIGTPRNETQAKILVEELHGKCIVDGSLKMSDDGKKIYSQYKSWTKQ